MEDIFLSCADFGCFIFNKKFKSTRDSSNTHKWFHRKKYFLATRLVFKSVAYEKDNLFGKPAYEMDNWQIREQ